MLSFIYTQTDKFFHLHPTAWKEVAVWRISPIPLKKSIEQGTSYPLEVSAKLLYAAADSLVCLVLDLFIAVVLGSCELVLHRETKILRSFGSWAILHTVASCYTIYSLFYAIFDEKAVCDHLVEMKKQKKFDHIPPSGTYTLDRT